MFQKLESSKLKLLAFTSQSMHFDDGEILFRAGDPADCAYVIMEGAVEILLESELHTVVVGVLSKNDLFGELAVLNNAPRSATLRAKGQLRALRIGDDVFLKLVTENPNVALLVMRQLSQKLARSIDQFEALQEKFQDGGGEPRED